MMGGLARRTAFGFSLDLLEAFSMSDCSQTLQFRDATFENKQRTANWKNRTTLLRSSVASVRAFRFVRWYISGDSGVFFIYNDGISSLFDRWLEGLVLLKSRSPELTVYHVTDADQ